MKTLGANGVADKIGIGVSTVWKIHKDDPTFPRPFKISPQVTVWDEADIDNWLTCKKEKGNESQRAEDQRSR